MGIINQKAVESKDRRSHAKFAESNSHLNFMGGPSYKIGNPIFNLRLAASSCFFGEPQYYHKDQADNRPVRHPSGLNSAQLKYLRETLNAIDPKDWRDKSPKDLMESAIDAAIEYDLEATLVEAVRLRNEENIRTTPQVILVRAANHPSSKGTGLIRKYAKDILQRADEPAVQMAYQLGVFGRKSIPNSLKKAWADCISSCNDYQLSKYRNESREVKLVDVVNLCHPKSPSVDKLMKDELRVTEDTWEGILSTKGSSKKSWLRAIEKMGHMALLRNIRNFLDQGVDPKEFISKMMETAEKGRQLPFRYLKAYQVNQSAPGVVLDAIEECLESSLGELPHFSGRTMSLCDNSGSAHGTTTSSMGTMSVAEIGNLTGVLTGKVSDEGYVGVFGDKLDVLSIRKKSSIFEQTKKLKEMASSIGGSTENGIWLFWDQAIKNKEHWDNVFIYSDMQAGHGGLYGRDPSHYKQYQWGNRYIDVPKLILDYRAKVNPDVNVFLVQIAGYQDTIVPEFYDKTYILGGWGDGILRFANSMIQPKQ